MRNCESDVKHIIERIHSQDFPHENMEVIFVDDGSEDNTLASVLKYALRMNISYRVYHDNWKGLGFVRNVVLRNAQGCYVVWVDDGTIIPKDYVRKQIEFMEKHSNVGIAKGVIGVYSGSNRVATLENMSALSFYHKYAGKPTKKLPGTGGSVYRVEAARRAGGFNESIQGATEDVDISYRMLSSGWQIYITQVTFFKTYDGKLKKVWDKSFWYGYGSHFTLHKHKELSEILYKSTPAAGFLEGILISSVAYKLTHKKIAFYLPIHFFIKRIAWCLGFLKSHMDSYGHIKETVITPSAPARNETKLRPMRS